jgi:Cu/Ag efflux protein CusF
LRLALNTQNRSWSRLSLAVILAPTLGMSVCSYDRAPQKVSEPQKVTGPAAAVQTTTYNGVGVVKATNLKRPSVEIDHEEIKGLMPAMTMEFYVKDKSLLAGIHPGDRIEFTIENGVGGEKITAIRRR